MIKEEDIKELDMYELPERSVIFSTIHENATCIYNEYGIEKSWEYLYALITYAFTGNVISDDALIHCLIRSFEERSRIENVNRKNRRTYGEWLEGNNNKKERTAIPPRVRAEVLYRDNYQCKHCGRGPEDGVKLHVDHIIPFSKGGSNDMSNLQTLCAECNMGKGNNEWN